MTRHLTYRPDTRRARMAVSVVTALFMGVGAGCNSLKHVAVNQVGDAFASGSSGFATDDDPDLIKAAAPFSLKLIESLLVESPDHRGLRLAGASGFTQYAYAFVQQDADELEPTDLAAAAALRERARRLYLRARDHGMHSLEVVHPGLATALRRDPHAALRVCTVEDVPYLYWTGAAWAGAIAVIKDRPDLIAELPQAEALMDRALELNESFEHGTIHTFMITYEMSRPGGKGDPALRSRAHFDRAVELSGGHDASPYVALAEAVCLPGQDRAQFESLLHRALAIDADAQPNSRLVNLIMQRRARWLLGRVDDLFLPEAPHETP